MPIFEYPTFRDGYFTRRAEGPPTCEYAGRVLKVKTAEQRVMSDVYADVTTACIIQDDGMVRWVTVKAHFECDTRCRDAFEDWDPEKEPEVAAKLEAIRAAVEEKKRRAKERKRQDEEERERNAPRKGKRMVVTRGRKVPKGTVGTVFWIGDGRVGLDVTGKKDSRGWTVDPVWVNADYLKAVETEEA